MNYNKKHSDGRINIKPGKSYIISPYDPNFYDQIESGVRLGVKHLIELGYLTVGSCDGKHSLREGAHITIIFPDISSLNNTKIHLDKLGVEYYDDYSYKALAVEQINNIFLRNYENYYFLSVRSFKKLPFYLLPFKGFLRKMMMHKLSKLPPYENV
jgi:hypothetical protein